MVVLPCPCYYRTLQEGAGYIIKIPAQIMGDLNRIIIGGRIKPGTIDSGEKITDGEVSHRWTYFILASACGGNWKEYVKCVLYGKLADAYGKILRDDAKVIVWGALQIRPGKGGRYYANIVVEGLEIFQGFEHETWESRPERDATIPMQEDERQTSKKT